MTRRLVFCFAILCAFFNSCAIRPIYVPISQNVPLFDTNRNLQTVGYFGTNHAEIQAAYNPVSHVALASNVNLGKGITIYDVAIGTYDYSPTLKWRSEIFAGYGNNYNVASQTDILTLLSQKKANYTVEARYHKLYLQPAIGYFNSIDYYKINFSILLSARIGWNHFDKFTYVESVEQPGSAPEYVVYRNTNNVNILTIEPCITHKVGYGNVYGIMQLQTITPYTQGVDLIYTQFSQGLLFSMGVQYNFPILQK